MNKIVYMKFGSNLYGTNTPESDMDYKGIYIPSLRQLYLGNFERSINSTTGNDKSKNTSKDVDDEIYSLQRFIELACQGQTVTMDMLHAPSEALLEHNWIWNEIVSKRSKFYTKNLTSFTEYCRKQAAKYGIKGSRLNTAKTVSKFLESLPSETRMKEVWDLLPTGEHIIFLPPNIKDVKNTLIYQVCGKKYLETVKVTEVIKSLDVFIKEYGARALLAADNKGIDWKAISHALRAAYQLEQIYTEGTIIFPLKQAEYLKAVKQGKLDYISVVAPELESIMERTERLAEESDLPETVNKDYWDQFIYDVIEETYEY